MEIELLPKVRLKIADIIIGFSSKYKMKPITEENDWRFMHFISHDKTRADILLEVKLVKKLPAFENTSSLFFVIHPEDRRHNWTLVKNKNRYLLKQYLKRAKQDILLNNNFSKGIIYYLKDSKRYYKSQEQNNITSWDISNIIYDSLQIILINYFSRKKGLIFHSMAIGNGYKGGMLFVGPTRSGKSTMARLWHRHSPSLVLNDDRVAARNINGIFFIYGTPWHGDFSDYLTSKQEKARLTKIFFIYHSPKNIATRVYGKEAFNLLFPNTFPTFWDKEGLNRSFAFCHELIQRIPCYKLGFKNDKRIIDFVKNIK